MSRFKILMLTILVIINGNVFAQNSGDETIDFSFDYASFKGQDGYVYLETYYCVSRSYLTYNPDDNRYKAEFTIQMNIFRDDSLFLDQAWKSVDYVDSLGKIESSQRLLSINHFILKPNEYKLRIKLSDSNSGSNGIKELSINLLPFYDDNLSISDIIFASNITPTQEKNQYYKNGYCVIPNSDRFYGTGLPMLMAYSEIYNLKKQSEADTTKYWVTYRILNSNEETIREFPTKCKIKPGNSAVEIGGLNIITFTSGTYFLEISVADSANDRNCSKKAKFYIYRPGDYARIQKQDSLIQLEIAEKSIQLIQGLYQSMIEKEIDEEFDAASYIATSEEKSIYKTLDIKGKRQFMPQFWTRRDQTPETSRNEYREAYLTRVSTAEREFRGFKKGWKSDEGRVLLVYGDPDEVERFPSSNESKAYRIWRYFAIQGGVEFIFVDKRGWGEYELVHSTARGELYDQNWSRWIDTSR